MDETMAQSRQVFFLFLTKPTLSRWHRIYLFFQLLKIKNKFPSYRQQQFSIFPAEKSFSFWAFENTRMKCLN